MKTSATQFEMLINFMEEHGDLNKPSKNPRGRIINIQKWETITNILNSDPTGEAKVTEKWKKVWSDFKNNTKKKAAKINRAVSGTGGGPAQHTKLNHLEQRVLRILGPRAATGFTGVVEAGIIMEQDDPDRTVTLTPTPPAPIVSPELFTGMVAGMSPIINIEFETWNMPGTSQQGTSVPPPPPSPPPPQPQQERVPFAGTPARQGHTPRRRRGRSTLRVFESPRRGARPRSHVDYITEHFLQTDEEWRKLLHKRMEDEIKLERERLNIRQIEIELQQKWQDIATSAIEVLNKISNSKLCKD